MVAHWPRLVKIMFASNKLLFLVFCLTDLMQTSLSARSSEVIMSAKAGEICDMKHDVLLVEDTSSDSSYLQCLPAGRGLGGFWERVPCQPGQKFFFTEQKCDNNPHQKSLKPLSSVSPAQETTTVAWTTPTTISSTESLTTIEDTTVGTSSATAAASTVIPIIYASLNENCANGVRCEFGTICDYLTHLCSCPHGLINIPGTKLCDIAPTTTTFASYPTTTVADSSTHRLPTTTEIEEDTTESEPIATPTVPETTSKKYSIALELFTQDIPTFIYPVAKLISPGSSCKNAEANCGGGSYCNTDNYVCSCPTETVDESGICIHIKVSAGINERCDGHTKCTGWSICMDGVCRCQSPLIQNGNQCLPSGGQHMNQQQSKPNQSCDKGQQCMGGSMCSTVTLVCTCPIGSHSVGDSCVSLTAATPTNSSIGHNCNVNSDCIKGAYCSAGTNPPSCQCLSTNVYVNDACFKIISPGKTGCDLDEQCSASYQGSRCSRGTCICPNGLAAQSETCKPVTLNPGDICRNNEACSGGATCFQNVCVCPLGYVALSETCININHNKSSHSTAIGERCTNKTKHICMSGSQCLNGICQCPSETILVNDTCQTVNQNDTNEALFFPLDLGMILINMTQIENPSFIETRCKSHGIANDCAHNEICNNGICDCVEGFIRVNTICQFKYVKVGGSCHKHQICLGGSECFEAICTCLPGLKNLGGKCLPAATKFQLDCPVGTTLIGNHCQNLTQEDISMDAFCTDNRQCGRGFVCLNHKCECPIGTHKKLSQCWRNPGGSCSNGEVCDGCSVCLRDICTCSGNVAPINGICPTNIARPNERCNTGQCCIGASECIQGICVCPEGTQLLNQECSSSIIPSPPFGPCNKSHVCTGGSTCSNGMCMCPSDQLVLANKCQFPPVVNPAPGDACNRHTDQCTSGSTCEHGVCVCPPGQYPIDKVCIPNIPGIPGDSCTDIDPCVHGVICMYGMCQCPEKQMWSTDKCIAVSDLIMPGEVCSSVQQCGGGSNCQNGRCTCNTNQVVVNAQCKVRSVFPNEECQPPQECTGNSQCIQGYCLCSTNSMPVDGVCILAFPQPGDSCNPAFSQCSGGSTCNLGICVCPQGQEASNGECGSGQIIAQPGQFCDPAIYLCTKKSSCINNKCTCDADYIVINSRCEPQKVKPNSNCHPSQQCTGGAQCLEGSCLCPANSIASSTGTCISVQPAPGEICDINFSVCRGGSVCIHSKCSCQQGLSIVNEVCSTGQALITAKPNEFCDPHSYICSGGSSCVNGQCTCPANNLNVDNVCQVANPLPFQSCKSPQVCAAGSVCIEGTCICPAGKLAINNACQSIPMPGEKCSSDVPVCSGGATCVNSICVCPINGNRAINGKCNTANLGQFCTEDAYQCLDGSKCKDNICACPSDKVLSNSKCLNKKPSPGSACTSQQTCSGGAICIQNICTCPIGFVSGANNRCIPFSGNPSPNEKCTPTQTCTGGSNCINGLCQCPNNGHPIRNVCQSSSQLSEPGKSCKVGQICIGGSICTNGICICPINQISKGSICEAASGNNVGSGGSCSSNVQCGGGTTCVNGKCMCPVNSVVYSNQCIPKRADAGRSCILFVQTCTGGSRCLGGMCVCPQNQVAISGACGVRASFFVHSVALQDSKYSNPGEQCNQKQTCLGGSKCIEDICQCPRGFRRYGDRCIQYAQSYKPPGSWCLQDKQCTGNAICNNSACVCPANMSVVEGECTVTTNKAFINGSCILTTQCMDGLICLLGVCQCLNNTKCQGMGHFTSPPGGSCAALQSCSGGSICRSGWCVCPEATMVVINGFCLISNNNSTTSQPDAEEVVSDYEEESSATDDLPNPIDISQPNLPPVLNVGQPSVNGGQQFVNSAQQQPGNIGQQFGNGGQQMTNGGQQIVAGGQRVVNGGQQFVAGGQFVNNSPHKGAQPLHNSGQSAVNFGQQSINVGRLSTNVGQPSLNIGQPSFNGGLQSLSLGQAQFLQQVLPNALGVAPRSPTLGFSSESVSSSVGMGSLMTNANFNPLQLGFSNLPNASVLKPTIVKSSNFTNSKQFVRPGASCVPTSVCTGGSKCILGMCLCDDQFQIIGQICVRQVPPIRASPPMGSCQNGEPCTGGAICDGQICQCLPGTELRSSLCQPLTQMPTTVTTPRSVMPIIVVPPMASCASGERCGGNSMCNRVTYVCECPGDLQPMQGHCVNLINKNRTPIQNSPNSLPSELTQIPVASAWQNPSNTQFVGGKSEIYKPIIYSMGIPTHGELVQGPPKSTSFQNSKASGLSFPSAVNIGDIEKPNAKMQLNGFPLASSNILTESEYNHNNFYKSGYTPLATASMPTSGTISANTLIDTLPPSHSASSMTNHETSGEAVEASISAPPNSQCGRGKACTGGSFCVHFKCRCPEGTVANEFDMCQKALSSSGSEIQGIRLGGQCTEEKTCAGAAVCISGRCRCPANTMQDGPVCISLKDSGKQRFFSAPILHADATSICPKGAEPIKESDGDKYIQCDASRPSSCPWGWYCYATDKALEGGPYFCCPTY